MHPATACFGENFQFQSSQKDKKNATSSVFDEINFLKKKIEMYMSRYIKRKVYKSLIKHVENVEYMKLTSNNLGNWFTKLCTIMVLTFQVQSQPSAVEYAICTSVE